MWIWLAGCAAQQEVALPEEQGSLEEPVELAAGQEVPEGTLFPDTEVALADGTAFGIGVGQVGRVVLTFVYTQCPMPEYCPLVVSKLQALQPALPDDARIVVVTIDPAHDTRAVLQAFGREAGAIPGRWDFGRVPDEVLFGLAEKAGLKVHGRLPAITHDVVVLLLGDGGRLVRRIRGTDWSTDDVVAALGPAVR
jgi:protein SCO1/2